jgi:hypothetical protein
LWLQQRFDFVVASHSLSKFDHPKEIPPSKPLFPALLDYDTQVHVYPRPLFLEKWVFAPNCFCSIAVNNSGGVVGYGVIRTTLGEGRIGPLFADNSSIARALCHDVPQSG